MVRALDYCDVQLARALLDVGAPLPPPDRLARYFDLQRIAPRYSPGWRFFLSLRSTSRQAELAVFLLGQGIAPPDSRALALQAVEGGHVEILEALTSRGHSMDLHRCWRAATRLLELQLPCPSPSAIRSTVTWLRNHGCQSWAAASEFVLTDPFYAMGVAEQTFLRHAHLLPSISFSAPIRVVTVVRTDRDVMSTFESQPHATINPIPLATYVASSGEDHLRRLVQHQQQQMRDQMRQQRHRAQRAQAHQLRQQCRHQQLPTRSQHRHHRPPPPRAQQPQQPQQRRAPKQPRRQQRQQRKQQSARR